MFEAYAIGITLRAHNLISPQLALLAKEFENLDLLTGALNKSLAKISVDTTGLRGLTTATNASNRAFERATAGAAAYEHRLAAIGRVSGGVPSLPGGFGRGSSGSGPTGRGPTGVGGMHGGNVHVGPGGVGLGTVGFAAGAGYWPLLAAGGSLYAGKSLFEAAKELNTEQNRFRLFGMTEAQNQEAFNFAKNNQIYGTSQIDRLAAMREAQGVFRESGLQGSAALQGAKLAAPLLAKLDFLTSSLDDESKARMHTSNLSMLRYVESSGGLKSAEEFNRIADFGYKLNVSSGGTVNWQQLQQFKARAGAAGFHLTDDAMARLEPVIAEMKGGAVGFGLSTMFNRLTGAIRIPNQIAHELTDSGIWDPTKVIYNQNGGIKRFIGNPLGEEKTALLGTNPELFYETVIRPLWEKLKLSQIDIARQNVMALGTTGGRNMTLVDNQMDNIHRSIDALNKTLGIVAAFGKAKDSLSGQEQEFGNAWKDFKANFGTTALPFFTGVLQAGSHILRQLPDGTSPIGNAMTTAKAFSPGLSFLSSAWDWLHPGGEQDRFVSRVYGKKGFGFDSGAPSAFGSPFIAPSAQQPIQITVQSVLDGQVVAQSTANYLSRSANAPQTGISTYDQLSGAIPAGGLGH